MTSLYNKICILSPGRSGTSLLMASLSHHPDILPVMAGEMFCLDTLNFAHYHPFLQNKYGLDFSKTNNDFETVISLFNQTSYEYINHILLHEDILKILYYQFESVNHVHHSLLARPDILIVHLIRKNLLELYCSQQRLQHKVDQMVLDYDHLMSFLRYYSRMERYIDCIFSNQIIKIYYEDLVYNWNSTIERILTLTTFRNIRVSKVCVKDYKYNYIEDFIINKDIVERLKGTEFCHTILF